MLGSPSNNGSSDAQPCGCCGFLVFEEPAGSHSICRVCGWEDDAVQLANPTLEGGEEHAFGSVGERVVNHLAAVPVDHRAAVVLPAHGRVRRKRSRRRALE